jgi:hypothetical protein
VFGSCKDESGVLHPNQEFSRHQDRKRNCSFLDRSFSSDWVTCLHDDNPTALQVCSFEHCPEREIELRNGHANIKQEV